MTLFDRVGSCFPPLYLACYDTHDNRIPFKSTPEVTIKLQTIKGVLFHVGKMKTGLSPNKFTLEVKVWFMRISSCPFEDIVLTIHVNVFMLFVNFAGFTD